MFTLELLETLKQQEEKLQFSSFHLEDAYTLGTMLRETGKKTPKPIAVRIVLDDLIVYNHFYRAQAPATINGWIKNNIP